jgi:hypothetical protein
MTNVLTTARKRRAELLKEVAALDQLIVFYEHNEKEHRTATNDQSVIIAAVHNILVDAGTSMGQHALVDALRAQGIQVKGKNPCKTLGTILWRSKKFNSGRREGYWPNTL